MAIVGIPLSMLKDIHTEEDAGGTSGLVELTRDQARLLYLLSLYTKPARSSKEKESWMKDLALKALIYHLITKHLFSDYDYAPLLAQFFGLHVYMNVSQEGEDDVHDLRELGLVQRLKLSTMRHMYIAAYRVTERGMEALKTVSPEDKEAVDKALSCPACGRLLSVEIPEKGPQLICLKDMGGCGFTKFIDLFSIEDVPYVAKGYFPKTYSERG